MYEIKRIKILTLARIFAILGFVAMLVTILPYMLFFGAYTSFGSSNYYYEVPWYETYWPFIVMPLVGAVGGFLWGVLAAWIYNLTSSWFGGVKLDIVLSQESQQSPPQQK